MIIEYSIIKLNVRSRFCLSHIRFSKYHNNCSRTHSSAKAASVQFSSLFIATLHWPVVNAVQVCQSASPAHPHPPHPTHRCRGIGIVGSVKHGTLTCAVAHW